VETLAERLWMKPGTLRRTLAKMTEAGYVPVEGSAEYGGYRKSSSMVTPTRKLFSGIG
jgi:DNA-binding IclR family transcriptional regulator